MCPVVFYYRTLKNKALNNNNNKMKQDRKTLMLLAFTDS